MTPTPYLFFNGQCADALAAYADIFGGEIMDQMPASGMPPEYDVPEERKNWVMHARIRIGDGYLMASDDVTGSSPAMAGTSVMVELPTAAEGKTVFDRLAEGGEIQMAWAPTFWSTGFGTLTDRFGIKWMIGSAEQPST